MAAKREPTTVPDLSRYACPACRPFGTKEKLEGQCDWCRGERIISRERMREWKQANP